MQVNVLEAKSQLSKLLKAALEGEEVIIARNGEPMVKLVPISKPRKLGGWGRLKSFGGEIDGAFTPEVERGDRTNGRGRPVRLLLDTQVALWWLVGSPRLIRNSRDLIATSSCVVSVASIWEVAINERCGLRLA